MIKSSLIFCFVFQRSLLNCFQLSTAFALRNYRLSAAQSVLDIAQNLVSKTNATKTLLNIISLGDEWTLSPSTPYKNVLAADHLTRVSGCLSDVRIEVSSEKADSSDRYHISGIADSRIANGLLALLCKGLSNKTRDEILSIDSNELVLLCGLDGILPPGRLNGFQNILRTIQSEVYRIHQRNPTLIASELSHTVNDDRNQQVAMLLSGGVDSSVALKLLLLDGYKVRAFYLKIWLEDELSHLNECPWEEDLLYAQQVCDQLNVTLETISLQKEYWDEVVQYTLAEARVGRTPNPDIMCNSRIKFGMFYDYIGKYYHKVATGHYAQVRTINKDSNPNPNPNPNLIVDPYSSYTTAEISDDMCRMELICSEDSFKDQTYFLSNLRQDQVAKALFPIGHLNKKQVRELAQTYNLPTKARKDSQGICFLGKLKFDDFIEHYLGQQPGDIREFVTGEIVGRHRGLWFHTIGQRKGLGPVMAVGTVHLGPWYVAAKDTERNTLYVTNDLKLVERAQRQFRVSSVNWIRGVPPTELSSASEGLQLMVKLRHGPNFAPATVTLEDPNDRELLDSKSMLKVILGVSEKGIAPGQFAAFYQDGICLGAGVIAEPLREEMLLAE